MSHRLWRGDERVPLTPKAFDLLRYLVEHRDRLVGQNEILETIWPSTHVHPEVVKKQILEIRRALGDRAGGPGFIETFPKRGYQFVAPVRDARGGAPTEPPDVEGVRSSMVGRDGALRQLEDVLERAHAGERQLVFITGEAGAGKTTLADAFHRLAARKPGLRVARGQCVEGFGGKEAYYPVLDALGAWVKDGGSGPVAQALDRYAPTWRIQFPSLVTPQERDALRREVHGAMPARMLREICEALEALTATDAFVLILEDLHWSDPSTLDLLSALARRRGPAKCVVVGTYRADEVAGSDSPLRGLKQDLVVHGLCREIALERLREAEVAGYLGAEFPGHDFDSGLARVIHCHSDGNPLFMASLIQDLVKRGIIAGGAGRWRLSVSVDELSPAVPETLRELIALRFDALSPDERQVLMAASVAGERFSVLVVEAAADVAGADVERICEDLTEKQRLIRSAGSHSLPDGRVSASYEFRHALYRQAVYERLTDAGRTKLHREIGERLRTVFAPDRPDLAAEVAEHLEAGGQARGAIDFLILAAENADRRFAYRESIQHLRHALRLAPALSAPSRAELEIRLLDRVADAHYWLGSMRSSAEAYEAEAARAEEAGLPAAQVRALSHVVRPYGLIDPDRGIAAIERAVRLAEGIGEPILGAQTEFLAAGTRLMYGAWRESDWVVCVSAREAMLKGGESAFPAYHRMIHANLSVLRGHYADALAELEEGIPRVDEPTSLMVHLFALSGKTMALLQSGRLGELLRTLRSGRAAAERNGNAPWLFLFREAWLRTVLCDFEGVRKLTDEALAADPEYPTDQPATIGRLAAGHAALALGRPAEAERLFREILDPGVTSKFFLHWHWRMRARLGLCDVRLASGKRKQARDEADALVEAASATAEPNLQALARDARARIAIEAKDWKSAEVDVRAAAVLTQEFEIPTSAWRVHATAADLFRRSDRAAAAETHRAKAAAIVHELVASLDVESMGRSLLDAAAARGV